MRLEPPFVVLLAVALVVVISVAFWTLRGGGDHAHNLDVIIVSKILKRAKKKNIPSLSLLL